MGLILCSSSYTTNQHRYLTGESDISSLNSTSLKEIDVPLPNCLKGAEVCYTFVLPHIFFVWYLWFCMTSLPSCVWNVMAPPCRWLRFLFQSSDLDRRRSLTYHVRLTFGGQWTFFWCCGLFVVPVGLVPSGGCAVWDSVYYEVCFCLYDIIFGLVWYRSERFIFQARAASCQHSFIPAAIRIYNYLMCRTCLWVKVIIQMAPVLNYLFKFKVSLMFYSHSRFPEFS